MGTLVALLGVSQVKAAEVLWTEKSLLAHVEKRATNLGVQTN